MAQEQQDTPAVTPLIDGWEIQYRKLAFDGTVPSLFRDGSIWERIDPDVADMLRRMAGRIATLQAEWDHRGCPCLYVDPCSYACTCVHPTMSGGCSRCARWGNRAQQKAAAERLAALEAQHAATPAKRGANVP